MKSLLCLLFGHNFICAQSFDIFHMHRAHCTRCHKSYLQLTPARRSRWNNVNHEFFDVFGYKVKYLPTEKDRPL